MIIGMMLAVAASAPTPPPLSAALQKFFPLGYPVDDAYVSGAFNDNPARISEWARVHRARTAVLGRVAEIAAAEHGYVIELAPRPFAAFGVLCKSTRTTEVARLHRGDLLIVSGLIAAPLRNGLPLTSCRIEYRFDADPEIVGQSYAVCLSELMDVTCPKDSCGGPEEGHQERADARRKMAMGAREVRKKLGKKKLACTNPIVATLFACEKNSEVPENERFLRVSCTQRHEIVDARNAIPTLQGAETEGDGATRFEIEKPPRSRLYDAMAKSGEIADNEP